MIECRHEPGAQRLDERSACLCHLLCLTALVRCLRRWPALHSSPDPRDPSSHCIRGYGWDFSVPSPPWRRPPWQPLIPDATFRPFTAQDLAWFPKLGPSERSGGVHVGFSCVLQHLVFARRACGLLSSPQGLVSHVRSTMGTLSG